MDAGRACGSLVLNTAGKPTSADVPTKRARDHALRRGRVRSRKADAGRSWSTVTMMMTRWWILDSCNELTYQRGRAG